MEVEDDERQGLVVDVNTGRQTVKRVNRPVTPSNKTFSDKTRADNASTRSLKSFAIDAVSDDEDTSMLANLDNVDKPSVVKDKQMEL